MLVDNVALGDRSTGEGEIEGLLKNFCLETHVVNSRVFNLKNVWHQEEHRGGDESIPSKKQLALVIVFITVIGLESHRCSETKEIKT